MNLAMRIFFCHGCGAFGAARFRCFLKTSCDVLFMFNVQKSTEMVQVGQIIFMIWNSVNDLGWIDACSVFFQNSRLVIRYKGHELSFMCGSPS